MEIFCCRAHHRRSTNVDVLDDLFEIHTRLGSRLLKRIKIHYHHVNRRDAMLFHCRTMPCDIAPVEDAAMHFRLQRLHTAVEHLRKAGEVGDVAHLDPLLAQQLRGATGRDQLHVHRCQRAREFHQTALVSDAQDGSSDLRHDSRFVTSPSSAQADEQAYRTFRTDYGKTRLYKVGAFQTLALAFRRTWPFSVSTEYSTAWHP